jgi:hypothetical protein
MKMVQATHGSPENYLMSAQDWGPVQEHDPLGFEGWHQDTAGLSTSFSASSDSCHVTHDSLNRSPVELGDSTYPPIILTSTRASTWGQVNGNECLSTTDFDIIQPSIVDYFIGAGWGMFGVGGSEIPQGQETGMEPSGSFAVTTMDGAYLPWDSVFSIEGGPIASSW